MVGENLRHGTGSSKTALSLLEASTRTEIADECRWNQELPGIDEAEDLGGATSQEDSSRGTAAQGLPFAGEAYILGPQSLKRRTT